MTAHSVSLNPREGNARLRYDACQLGRGQRYSVIHPDDRADGNHRAGARLSRRVCVAAAMALRNPRRTPSTIG
jgi:hypothetical protein